MHHWDCPNRVGAFPPIPFVLISLDLVGPPRIHVLMGFWRSDAGWSRVRTLSGILRTRKTKVLCCANVQWGGARSQSLLLPLLCFVCYLGYASTTAVAGLDQLIDRAQSGPQQKWKDKKRKTCRTKTQKCKKTLKKWKKMHRWVPKKQKKNKERIKQLVLGGGTVLGGGWFCRLLCLLCLPHLATSSSSTSNFTAFKSRPSGIPVGPRRPGIAMELQCLA